MPRNCLIVGAGSGLSASLAHKFAEAGYAIALAARNVEKLGDLCAQTSAIAKSCDVADTAAVNELFSWHDSERGTADVVVYNPSARVRGAAVDLEPEAVKAAIEITAFGGFLVAQQAASRMLAQGSGSILLTGASASVKGYAQSSCFAMGKFALRGLAQSLARELAPQNVHVAHFVIDGGIRSDRRPPAAGEEDALLDPDAIAESYLHVAEQQRSAWTWEIELRPWVEKF